MTPVPFKQFCLEATAKDDFYFLSGYKQPLNDGSLTRKELGTSDWGLPSFILIRISVQMLLFSLDLLQHLNKVIRFCLVIMCLTSQLWNQATAFSYHHSIVSDTMLTYFKVCSSSTLTSARASASKVLWSPKLAWRVVLGEDRWAWLSMKAFLSGWLTQPGLPKVVRRLFSGLSAGPLLTVTLCGLQGLGITLGGCSGARLGLWLSALFLWRGTVAPSDRTLTLRKIPVF